MYEDDRKREQIDRISEAIEMHTHAQAAMNIWNYQFYIPMRLECVSKSEREAASRRVEIHTAAHTFFKGHLVGWVFFWQRIQWLDILIRFWI